MKNLCSTMPSLPVMLLLLAKMECFTAENLLVTALYFFNNPYVCIKLQHLEAGVELASR